MDLKNIGRKLGDKVDGVEDGQYKQSDTDVRVGSWGRRMAQKAEERPVAFAYTVMAAALIFAVLALAALL